MKKISREDAQLFREQVGRVRRVIDDRAAPVKRPISPRPRFKELDEKQVLVDLLSEQFEPAEMATGEELLYIRPGLQHKTLRKLRRGMYSMEAELDLHGMTVSIARQAVADFLYECKRRNIQCPRIIHGKGLGSRHRGPVLKRKLGGWLRQRNEVLAYCSARAYDGGTGAVYVLLKRN